jgi:hypothetical protein
MITKEGIKIIMDRAYNKTPERNAPDRFIIGTGDTEPTFEDTELDNQVEFQLGQDDRQFLVGYPDVDLTNLKVNFIGFLNSIEGNGNNLTELGIIESTTGKLYSRNLFPPLEKNDSVEVSFVQEDEWEED